MFKNSVNEVNVKEKGRPIKKPFIISWQTKIDSYQGLFLCAIVACTGVISV